METLASFQEMQTEETVSEERHKNAANGDTKKELLSKGSKKKTTAVVLAVVLVAFIVAALVYFLKPEQAPVVTPSSSYINTKQGLTLESVIAGEFNPKTFNGSWVSDTEILYKSREGDLILYNARTNKSRVILSSHVEILKASFHHELSADHRYLMLANNYQKLYRYTFLAFYHIVDLETRKSWPVTDINGGQILLQLVQWAPVGNAFVYVYMNDIYYRTSAREQPVQEFRLTRTGRPGTIYNGVPDWVYEEEILESNKALWFSPDGAHLVFATFNDSRTPVMNIPYYGAPGDLRYQYTQAVNIRYPKPGRPNPTVSLNVVSLAELQYQKPVTQFDIPPRQSLKEPVLSLVAWAAPHQLIAIWMNRVQNEAAIVLCSTQNNSCQEVFALSERSGWVSLTSPLFSPDGTKMALVLSVDQGNDAGPYRHLTLIDLNNRGPARPVPLTSGKFEVTELLAWDQQYIFFLTTEENEPGYLKVGKVPATVEGAPHTVECVSCPWDKTEGGDCHYTGAVFSQKYSYYMQTCAGPVVPEIALFSKEGEKILTWERNSRIRRKLGNLILPENKEMRVPIAGASGNMMAHVRLHLPPGIDTSGKTKYPLLVQVYGGPGSNMVTERFNIDWYSHLVVSQNVIYAKIDGRGSGLKGDNMLFANYKKLGTYEIHDQINVTKYLIDKLKYIDEKRTAIWGWSYGGYATGMVMAQDIKGVFKCGISVAPVTDWLLYDTLYTERYMGLPTPDDNYRGYEEASLNNKVDNFKNKLFFLIHGTLDDNVHYQQSMMLAKALETNDILFEQQSYPDEAHGLSDVRPHLYHSIDHFLKQCFSKPQQH
ncbi:dipeptidyl peptidase 4 omega isoform X3 [Rhodnius prolixus]|uniref:dipeptidyl peptidase 4 omega isoform X3 n=1 Tax=Rhodnius prolixus TaxID=13249 RepID=UPI003D187752